MKMVSTREPRIYDASRAIAMSATILYDINVSLILTFLFRGYAKLLQVMNLNSFVTLLCV